MGAGLRKGRFGGADDGGRKFRIGGVLIGSGGHDLRAEIFGGDRVTQFQVLNCLVRGRLGTELT